MTPNLVAVQALNTHQVERYKHIQRSINIIPWGDCIKVKWLITTKNCSLGMWLLRVLLFPIIPQLFPTSLTSPNINDWATVSSRVRKDISFRHACSLISARTGSRVPRIGHQPLISPHLFNGKISRRSEQWPVNTDKLWGRYFLFTNPVEKRNTLFGI